MQRHFKIYLLSIELLLPFLSSLGQTVIALQTRSKGVQFSIKTDIHQMAHEGFSLILNMGVGGFGNGRAQQGFQGALSQLNNYNSFKPSLSSGTLSRPQSLEKNHITTLSKQERCCLWVMTGSQTRDTVHLSFISGQGQSKSKNQLEIH